MSDTLGTPFQPEMARAYLEETQFNISMLSLAQSCGNHCQIFKDLNSDVISPQMNDCLKTCVNNFERSVRLINKNE